MRALHVEQRKTLSALSSLESVARQLRQEKIDGYEPPSMEQQKRIFELILQIGELTGAIPLTVSVREAARIMGIPNSTAYILARRTDFPSLRVGEQAWAVRVHEIPAWLERESKKVKVKEWR